MYLTWRRHTMLYHLGILVCCLYWNNTSRCATCLGRCTVSMRNMVVIACFWGLQCRWKIWWFEARRFCSWSFWCKVYWQIGVVKCLIGVCGMMQVPSSYSKNNSRNTWLLASNFAPPTTSSNTLAKHRSSTLDQFWVICLLPLFRKWGAYALRK